MFETPLMLDSLDLYSTPAKTQSGPSAGKTVSWAWRSLQTAELRRLGACQDALAQSLHVISDISSIIASILDAQDNSVVRDKTELPLDPLQLSEWRTQLQRFHEDHCEPQSFSSHDGIYVARACYECGMIVLRQVSGVPLRDPSVQHHIDQMYHSIRAIDQSTWRLLPCTRIVVLVHGLLAARDISKRSFYKAHLARAMYQAGKREWKRVRNVTLKLLQQSRTMQEKTQRTRRSSASSLAGSVHADRSMSLQLKRSGSLDVKASTSARFLHSRSLPSSKLVTPHQEVSADPFDFWNFVE
jgi:hypothetical protein